MPIVQVRDISDETVARLKTRAAAEGLSLSAFLRRELERLAGRPTNAEILDQIDRHRPKTGPTTQEIVDIIRRTRDAT
jgi:hypothetical protein